jgi:hypothetical protein
LDYISGDMRLSEWIHKHGRGAMAALSRDSGLSYITVFRASRGRSIKTYATAKALSDATGGDVSVQELCESREAVR